ncbi:FAD-dependent monooxygenase [Micromonospora sp. LOL_023]|uniref:FAD-dependent monooxygenase n=1 Tax=Micromonospora sp. LOL_023 TaxID=3345418 RepID=UPI003A84FDDF
MTATHRQTDEFIVVGGGIGGLGTALALARAGRQVRVLERAAVFGEVGAGIQLAPNATRLLREWGLLDRLIAVGLAPRHLVLADAQTGRELHRLDLSGPFTERYLAPYVVAHRRDLLDLLLAAAAEAGAVLEPDREVVGIRPGPDAVDIDCADGQRYRARAVVAADGLHSRFRAMVSDDQPICSGYVAYRGAIPIGQASQLADLDDVIAFIGPGMHFVQYALRGGSYYNQVAVFRSDRYQQGAEEWGGPDELRETFSRACPHVRTAVRTIRTDQRWPMYDRVPIDNWVLGGRFTLLGDAAHPMLQYLAQGACQALEDAAALADAVARHLPPGPLGADAPVRAALDEFARERAPRTARVQRNARTWGDIWHVDGIAAALRDDALAHRGPTDYRATDWVFGHTAAQRGSSPVATAEAAAPPATVTTPVRATKTTPTATNPEGI